MNLLSLISLFIDNKLHCNLASSELRHEHQKIGIIRISASSQLPLHCIMGNNLVLLHIILASLSRYWPLRIILASLHIILALYDFGFWHHFGHLALLRIFLGTWHCYISFLVSNHFGIWHHYLTLLSFDIAMYHFWHLALLHLWHCYVSFLASLLHIILPSLLLHVIEFQIWWL